MKNYLFITYFFFAGLAEAQVSDNFADGNFNANPVWHGTDDQFIVNAAQQLQLNNNVAGTSYLSTAFNVSSLDHLSWQTSVRQSFSSSGSNYGKVYLVSDKEDLTTALHGYYLKFGEAGSNDAVELFRQNGLVSTSVCRAKNGGIATSFSVRVKVDRQSSGQWQISLDYAGGNNFVAEASGVDSTYTASLFMGVMCVYTASNASKFFYDDFYVGAGVSAKDNQPPQMQSANAASSTSVSLVFSEPLDEASAQSSSNYSGDQSLGSPATAVLQPDKKSVMITFSKTFTSGLSYQLTVSGVKDVAGNVMGAQTLPFIFLSPHIAQPKDIVITEIYPDPSPQIGLPAAEYVEVFNRSSDPIDLARWTISDGGTLAVLPEQIVAPGQYLVITSTTSLPLFSNIKNTIGVDGFPSLNNNGDDIILKSTEGKTIDSVQYSLLWYHDTDKQNGGWSLELIDLNNLCGEDNNWSASENPLGGTPGDQNSVNADKPDVTGPHLLAVAVDSTSMLLVIFNERLQTDAPLHSVFSFSPALQVSAIQFADRALHQIKLTLAAPLSKGELYTMNVSDIYDCNGNVITVEFAELTFSLPEPADSLDILVNEVLFNPRPSGVDFIEVYNNSEKYISMARWKLANFENDEIKDPHEISPDILLAPHHFAAFTSDTTLLKNNYPSGESKNFVSAVLPSLPDDQGSIALVNEGGHVIDFFLYDKGFHTRLLKDDEGVSLERISFSEPSNNFQNWTSASARSGFATPGYLNSDSRPEAATELDAVVVSPVIFAPINGDPDFTTINYKFSVADFVANVKIIDQQGHTIKTLGNNETLGADGFFRWDGDRDDGSRARMGYYFVWFEVFNIQGDVKTFRKRVIVSSR